MTKPSRLFNNQCLYCERTIKGTIFVCETCKVVDFCTAEHRVTGHSLHQDECETIQLLLEKREQQAKMLREDPDGNVFESNSMFWSIGESRPYTEVCVALIETISQIPTVKACEAASRYGIEWLSLNWAVDHHNVRHRVAALNIRLGKDQDAYDFIKWHATTGADPFYGWSSIYDLKNQDTLESLQVGRWTDENTHLSTMASVTLIKLRIWFNLQSLQNAGLTACKLPQEILDHLREECMATDIIAKNQQIMADIRNGKDIETSYMRPLEQQLIEMFNAVQRKSADFWPAIVERRGLAEMYESPDERLWEFIVAVSYGREAWEETPGAVEWIRLQLQRREGKPATLYIRNVGR